MLEILDVFSSAHAFHPNEEQCDEINCSDVIVSLKEKETRIISKYTALFITYEYASILKKVNENNEWLLFGKFFYANNSRLMLVESLELANIREILDELNEQGILSTVFKKLD